MPRIVHRSRRPLPAKRRQDVCVGIHRHADPRVTEHFHDRPGGHSCGEHERRTAMPRVMKPESVEARSLPELFPAPVDVARLDRRADGGGEYEPMLTPDSGVSSNRRRHHLGLKPRLVRNWSVAARRSLDRTRPSRTGREASRDHDFARRQRKVLVSTVRLLITALGLGPFSRTPCARRLWEPTWEPPVRTTYHGRRTDPDRRAGIMPGGGPIRTVLNA